MGTRLYCQTERHSASYYTMGLCSPVQLTATLCLLFACCVLSDSGSAPCPMLRLPPDSAGTGCFFIVFKEETSEGEMQHLLSTISKYAEDSRIYSIVTKVSKAITVKLSPYALELVKSI